MHLYAIKNFCEWDVSWIKQEKTQGHIFVHWTGNFLSSFARRKKMHAIRVYANIFRHFFRVIFLSIEWRSFFMCLGKFFSSENWILSRERENLRRNAAYESNQHDLNTLSLLVWIPHKYISECANNMWGDIFFELHYIFPFIFRLPLFSIAFSFSIIRMPEGSQSISLWDSF